MSKYIDKINEVVTVVILSRMASMNLYVKLFFAIFLLTTFAMSFFYILSYGFGIGALVAISYGLLVAVPTTLLMGGYQFISTRGMGLKSSEITPSQKKSLVVKGDMRNVFEACINALSQFGVIVEKKDVSSGIIEATTTATLKSCGEVISITLSQRCDGIVDVEIKSEPKLRTTIIDYGKGLENVMQMAELIHSAAENEI